MLVRNFGGSSPAVGIGVADAFTAGLVQRAGFDLLWVGSFEVATRRGLPDVNLITATEVVETVRQVRERSTLPIFVDADNGYGSDETALRALDGFAAAGAAAMSIEDNEFPKRNSLYATSDRRLTDTGEMARRISRLAGRESGVQVIARTEALVAGMGTDEAVRRCRAYADAGADALFVQADRSHRDQLGEVVERVHDLLPVVLAPTALPEVGAAEFGRMGASVVIYANVVMRTVTRAVGDMLDQLRTARGLDSVLSHMCELDEIFALTHADEWNRPALSEPLRGAR